MNIFCQHPKSVSCLPSALRLSELLKQRGHLWLLLQLVLCSLKADKILLDSCLSVCDIQWRGAAKIADPELSTIVKSMSANLLMLPGNMHAAYKHDAMWTGCKLHILETADNVRTCAKQSTTQQLASQNMLSARSKQGTFIP